MKAKYIILAVSLCIVIFGISILYKQQKADESNYVQLIQNDYAIAQSLEQLKEVSDVIGKRKVYRVYWYLEYVKRPSWHSKRR